MTKRQEVGLSRRRAWEEDEEDEEDEEELLPTFLWLAASWSSSPSSSSHSVSSTPISDEVEPKKEDIDPSREGGWSSREDTWSHSDALLSRAPRNRSSLISIQEPLAFFVESVEESDAIHSGDGVGSPIGGQSL